MRNNIFYSWQSDLPNNTNRSFIEASIKLALKKLNELHFYVELSIDRDTRNMAGAPDINESIFKKIDKARLFIADISIINSNSDKRKCPNPNVLIELGYAAKVLGWDRVICIYNLDYGSIIDLPFDLRQRKILFYSLNESNKSEIKNELSENLIYEIGLLSKNGKLFDKVDDYIKTKIDTEILTISGHLCKMILGYDNYKTLESTMKLLSMSDTDIENNIKKQKLIGFQIYKNFGINEHKFRHFADNAISSTYYSREIVSILVEYVSWIGQYDKLNSIRNAKQFFFKSDQITRQYIIKSPMNFAKNDKLPDRYILLKKLNSNEGKVIDFGDFPYKQRVMNLLNEHYIEKNYISSFISVIRQFIDITNTWLELTNGEFILDTFHNFEIKL